MHGEFLMQKEELFVPSFFLWTLHPEINFYLKINSPLKSPLKVIDFQRQGGIIV